MFISIFNFVWNNFTALAVSGSILSLIIMTVLFFGAKPLFDAIVSFIAPILKSLGSLLGKFVYDIKKMTAGTLLVLIGITGLAYMGGRAEGQSRAVENAAKKQMEWVHKNYTLTPKKRGLF